MGAQRGRLRSSLALVSVGCLLIVGCSARQTIVTAEQLVQSSQEADGARIVLTGRVQEIRLQSPSQGNTYTTFALADGTARAMVFGWGTLAIDSGDLVEVRGVFHSVAHVGTDTLYDTVEASLVRRLQAAPQLPGPSGPP